ncbi:MAG: tetratricopeptide repeat protein [bacterium]|nr:tetratricopeptide repeat protein [bacterium]
MIILLAIGIVAVGLISFLFFRKSSDTVEYDEFKPMRAPSEMEAPKKTKKKYAAVAAKDLPTLVKETKNAIVVIHTYDEQGNGRAQGTGFFINAVGHAVSNFHVFKGAYRAEVKTASGTFPVEKVLAEDAKHDLVLFTVRIKANQYNYIPFEYELPQVGERIMVIGNPLGLESTVSDGIVSARREFGPFGKVIQLTSPISSGSSGSPVLNMKGRVVGVATFQYKKGQNLNFAIPAYRVKELVPGKGKELASVDFEDDGIADGMDDSYSKGLVLYEAERYKAAITHFRESIKETSSDASAHYYLGMCYLGLGSIDAINHFKNAIDINADYIDAYCGMGAIYNKLNQSKEAIDIMEQAVHLSPNHPEALLQLGIAYAKNKDYPGAVTVLERALSVSEDYQTYLYLGISYIAVRKPSEGIHALEKCIELEPSCLEAYIGVSYAYVKVKNWTRGIKILNRAVLLDPQCAEIHYLLGVMHVGNNDFASAKNEQMILRNLKASYQYRNQLSSAISRAEYQKRYRRRGY